ncbi:hypothetical protein AB0M22_31020 [Nocardia sp. NPDC051756]|uniref:hypothetical protein n=1 Tax=Nocardia sp. NPDC051756 TaxID=3154751 RepID=UPI00342B5008
MVSLAGAGCDSVIDRAAAPEVEASSSPELVREAVEYGGWVLPADAKVLLVRKEIVRDRKYQIAAEMSPTDLSSILAQSRFTPPFARDIPPYLTTTIAGPDLATSPSVRRAQEWFTSPAGKVMLRDVVVDERDENTRIVHIEFRGV